MGAVLCGLDTAINYTKLSKAFSYILRNEGCAFLVTNEDSTYPTSDGLLPGGGLHQRAAAVRTRPRPNCDWEAATDDAGLHQGEVRHSPP